MSGTDVHKLDLSAARTGESLNLSGRKIEIVGASDKDASADLRVVYSDGSQRSYYEFKDEYEAESGREFSDILVTNTAQAGKYIEILVTPRDGDWDYRRRKDQTISEITSAVPLDDAALIAAIQDAELSVDELKALLQNDQDQRAPLTTLEGASFASQSGAGTNNVVTVGANASGVIIRHAFAVGLANNSGSKIIINGNTVVDTSLNTGGGSTGANAYGFTNMLVPAAQAIDLTVVGSYAMASLLYEVL